MSSTGHQPRPPHLTTIMAATGQPVPQPPPSKAASSAMPGPTLSQAIHTAATGEAQAKKAISRVLQRASELPLAQQRLIAELQGKHPSR